MARKKTDITEQIAQPDSNITVPKATRTPVTLVAQIEALEFGECCSRVQRVRQDMTMAEFVQEFSDLKAALRNNIAPSVRGAAKTTGADYSVEVTSSVTTPGQVYLVAIITRIS